ncbi:MAG: hypothetical protein WC756_03535 [Taibaiella sp.]|jgi:hypothetical protein
MPQFHVFKSPLEKKSIKDLIILIQKDNPGITQETIAEAIGYNRTALSKKDVGGEQQIKALLIYRFDLNKTSSNQKVEDVERSDFKPEDIMALLWDIKNEQKIISANLKTISNPLEKAPTKHQEKSTEAEKVEKVAHRSAEISTPGYGKKNDPLPKKEGKK